MGIAWVSVGSVGVSAVMVGLSTSTIRPVVSTARFGPLRTGMSTTGSSSGMMGTQTGTVGANVAGTITGSISGAAGSSTDTPQLISQFQHMTICPHLVCPVTSLQNVIQSSYLDKAGLANKCLLDYLGVIDSRLAKERNLHLYLPPLFCISFELGVGSA